MKIEIDYSFYRPAQKEVFLNPDRFTFVKAGRRFGKTEGAMFWLIDQALDSRALHLPCFWVSPTIEMARKVFDSFCKKYKDVIRIKNISRRQVVLLNGREIFFQGCDKPESLEGAGLWALVLDEARHIKKETVWTETLRPMLGDGVVYGGGRAVIISTPISIMHWFSQLIDRTLSDQESDSKAFIKTTLEGGNIPPEEIEKARATLPPAIFARNYLAQDTDIEGLIYREFGAHNLIESIPPWFSQWEVNCGLDYGASEDHDTVFTVVMQDRGKRKNIVLEECYLNQVPIDKVINEAKRLKAKYNIQTFWTDHNRPDYNRRLLKEGLRAVLTRKGPDSVNAGIETVKELLYKRENGETRLYFISHKTKRLQQEIRQYQWKQGTEKPLKENDDGMDSLRYVLTMTNKSHQSKINYY